MDDNVCPFLSYLQRIPAHSDYVKGAPNVMAQTPNTPVESLYANDLVTSADSEEEAEKACHKTQEIKKTAGMMLQK